MNVLLRMVPLYCMLLAHSYWPTVWGTWIESKNRISDLSKMKKKSPCSALETQLILAFFRFCCCEKWIMWCRSHAINDIRVDASQVKDENRIFERNERNEKFVFKIWEDSWIGYVVEQSNMWHIYYLSTDLSLLCFINIWWQQNRFSAQIVLAVCVWKSKKNFKMSLSSASRETVYPNACRCGIRKYNILDIYYIWKKWSVSATK